MIKFDIFPNMKRRCIALSLGVGHDKKERLDNLLEEYQLNATFYMNEKGENIDKLSGKHLSSNNVLKSVHYKNAIEECDEFFKCMTTLEGYSILHIWGDCFELETEEDWRKLRHIFKKISGKRNVWYATQEELYNYIAAQNALISDISENYFYNPTLTDIWIRKEDTSESMCIPAGRKINLDFSNEYPFKTISSKTQTVGRFTIVQDRVVVNDTFCPYDYLKIGEGVCVLPFVDENILTLKQYRYPIRSWQREFPGGFIDEGETPQEAAIRELSEETGYTVKEIQSLGEFHPSFGSTNERIYLFKAICDVLGQSNKEKSEIINMEIISVDVLKEEIREGKFMHGAGLAAWAKYIEGK